MVTPQTLIGSLILESLPASEMPGLVQIMRPFPLVRRSRLSMVGDPITRIYFPGSGLVSEAVLLSDGRTFEATGIGREGVVGIAAVFGMETALYEVSVQVSGAGWCVATDDLKQILKTSPVLHSRLLHYLQYRFIQASYSAACAGNHTVIQRCADKLQAVFGTCGVATLPLTHEAISCCLGVRRASITHALAGLEQAGAIQSRWGSIDILDVSRLEDASCGCNLFQRGLYGKLMKHIKLDRADKPGRPEQPCAEPDKLFEAGRASA